ncbi:MAG: alpha/beta hydrolase [Rhodobacter sp.]|nr:alpha/beta hydrolase [Rhodobacter sp.]
MTTVTGHNGVRLHVTTAGDPANPAILLIHGWSQHSLCWTHQLEALADRFYLIAPDLRGHGASDKPDAASAYDNSAPWAGDIAAIIDQLNLDQPILVGWSMGGWIVGDYLREHGDSGIGGLALVGSCVTTGAKSPDGVALKRHPDVTALGMLSDDQAENLDATLKFVRACTNDPLPCDAFATMVGFNMLVPPHIRKACRTRHEDYRSDYANLAKPAAVIWGTAERLMLPPMIEQALASIPNVQDIPLDGLGHAPFYEDPKRFNSEFAAFASKARCSSDEIPMEARKPI